MIAHHACKVVGRMKNLVSEAITTRDHTRDALWNEDHGQDHGRDPFPRRATKFILKNKFPEAYSML